MNQEALWDKFSRTGSVADYLLYSAAKNKSGTDFNNGNTGGNRSQGTTCG